MSTPAQARAAGWLSDWRSDPELFARTVVARACDEAAGSDAPDARDGVTDWLAAEVGGHLQQRGWRVAVAESCTGGGLGAALTAIGGSSAWVEGGVITYSNAAKTLLLGVPAGWFEQHGAVSRPVVEAMADGARRRLGVECAVAVSGIAGPSGGSADKPVGTVWLAWAGPESPASALSQGLWFPGNRAEVRLGATWVGLLGLLAL
jgi:nicotinamide-nucleotide amidase